MHIYTLAYARKMVRSGKWIELTGVTDNGRDYIAYNDMINQRTVHSYNA